jgi:hypothetical protein
VQSPKAIPEIKTPRNNNNEVSYLNEIQKVLPLPNKAELRRNLAGKSFDISATVAPNALGGLGSPRANGFQPNSSPNKPRGGEDIFSHLGSNTFNQTIGSQFGGNQQKLDVWKLLIKDEAEKFLVESEEKRLKKKTTQADYKSYLDRQMDQNKAQQHLKKA